MDGRREQLVIDTFVELADTLVSDYDISDFLHLLVERCVDVLQVHTAGVLVEDAEGTLRLAAATSDAMRLVEELEISQVEGPCLDAYQGAMQVLAEDLRGEVDRWPHVAPRAVEIGLLAVYAFPLRLREHCIGALNLYRDAPGPFHEEDIRLAQAFADAAAIGILQERKIRNAELRADQLQGALDTRVVIERASGILAERHHITTAEAFHAIRAHARFHNRKLREVCARVVEGDEDIAPSETAQE